MDGTTTTTSGGAGDDQLGTGASTGEQTQMLATALGDQCANCGARLAGDQRYCVECGERRGKPRYSMAGSGSGSSSGRPSAASGGRRRPRMTANATLIAGVGTLLLAMGVGVLIGRTSNSSPARNAEPVITVNSGGSGAAASGTPTTASTPSSTSSSASSKAASTPKGKAKATAAKLAAKLPAKAKVIPKKLKSAVVKQGQTCTAGTKGCTNGKFTGTFFGGG